MHTHVNKYKNNKKNKKSKHTNNTYTLGLDDGQVKEVGERRREEWRWRD
jgi:hypothetical protein